MNEKILIRPMSIWTSLLFFGIPSAIFSVLIYVVWPLFNTMGVPFIASYMVLLYGPFALLFFASLIAFSLEGNRSSRPRLKERFRLMALGKKDLLWTLLLIAFSIVSYLGLSSTAIWLAENRYFAPPDFLFFMFDSNADQASIPSQFLGVQLEGNWWIGALLLLILCLNILGEEFWFRGYILPRQELSFKKHTWLVHGLLWTLFHIFFRWNLLILLPIGFAIAFVAQKTKNTWPIIINSSVINLMSYFPIFIGIAGSG